MSNNMKTILIIAPHQDDEVIGCGGTMAKLIQDGCDVLVVHVFAGTSGVANVNERESRRIRMAEAKASAAIGGYKLLPCLGFKDRDRSRDSQLQSAIITVLRQVKPDVIFIPHKLESDYEHRLVAIEAREAAWLAASDIAPDDGKPLAAMSRIFYYEVWKNIDKPTVLSNIDNFVAIKREMLRVFSTQMDGSGWVEGSIGRNAYRGVTTAGNGYFEVFETESIAIEELLS